MPLTWLLERFDDAGDAEAIVWSGQSCTYRELRERFDGALSTLEALDLPPGASVVLDADYTPAAIAMLLAAVQNRNVVVPLAAQVPVDRVSYGRIAQARVRVKLSPGDTYAIETLEDPSEGHPLLDDLRQRGQPGLIVFSSGSTGAPKAILHDLSALMEKYKVRRNRQRIIMFLLFDHLGGFNTLMYTLANRGCVITLQQRGPEAIVDAIERHRAEVLPTSPTFLNLLLMSEAWDGRNLESLKLITYGTEMMPERTLARLREVFPSVRLLQTYGLTELGVLRSKSRSSDSLWMKVGGEDYETRVVDGVLHIRARSSMLGYLNAPSPFDDEGWFNTQDEVEQDGEWLRFKGRKSDIINVGGEKVFPAEVESVLLEIDNVVDATVRGESHAITGRIVVAELRLRDPEDPRALSKRVRRYCRERLAPFKVPVKIEISDTSRMSHRFKKAR